MAIRFSYECRNPRVFPKAYLLDISYLSWIVNSAEAVLETAIAQPKAEKFKYWFGDFCGHAQNSMFLDSQIKVRTMLDHARSSGFAFNQISETTLAKTDQSVPAL